MYDNIIMCVSIVMLSVSTLHGPVHRKIYSNRYTKSLSRTVCSVFIVYRYIPYLPRRLYDLFDCGGSKITFKCTSMCVCIKTVYDNNTCVCVCVWRHTPVRIYYVIIILVCVSARASAVVCVCVYDI